MQTTTNNHISTLGVFASIKRVLITICTSLVKACTLVDTSLDAAQDVADSGRILTQQLKQETQLTADAQLSALKSLKIV